MEGFKCLVCDKVLKTIKGIRNHVETKHNEDIRSIIIDRIQKKIYMDKSNVSCSLCDLKFTDINQIKNHMVTNHLVYIREGAIDKFIFIPPNLMDKYKDKLDIFVCPKCDHVSKSKKAFDRHLNRKTPCVHNGKGKSSYDSSTEDDESDGYVSPKDKMSKGEPQNFVCPKCDHDFKTKSMYERHLNRKTSCAPDKEGTPKEKQPMTTKLPKVMASDDDEQDDIVAEYVYLLQEREYIHKNDPVYKIGRTSQTFGKRFQNYPKDTVVLISMKVDNSREVEKKLLEKLKSEGCGWRRDIGNEYFSIKDIDKITKLFFEICFYGK